MRQKHDKWIVLTSVDESTEQIKFLANIDQFQLLIVGNRQTNQNWTWKNVMFLNIKLQKQLGLKTLKTTTHNSYTRKNIGYLYAIQNGAKFIYDIDDNLSHIVSPIEYFNFKEYDYGLVFDSDAPKILNPYAHFGQPLIWPRGYPQSEIHKIHYNNYICGRRRASFVQQGVVNGDADVDAIFRLTKAKNYKKIDVKFDETSPSVQYPIYKMAPYNSQNTLFTYEAFWSLYMPKSVTFRLTDIWRSYWAQRLMWLINGTVSFYGPNAHQSKNSHSNLKDLNEEKEMHLKTENLVKFLFDWNCSHEKFYDCVLNLSEEMAKRDFWSFDEVESIKYWLEDLTQIGYIEPSIVEKRNENKISSLSQSLYLNASLIDADFKVRYTPKLQNIDFNITDDLPEKSITLEYLKRFCELSNFTLKYNIEQIVAKSKYLDVTLLITFNMEIRPFTIELTQHIFGSYFKNIIYCGKDINKVLSEKQGRHKKFDSYTFIDIDVSRGYFHYYCMTKAIEMNLNTKGFLLMSDDFLLKYWGLDKLNTSRIWFPQKLDCSLEFHALPANIEVWKWWLLDTGKKAYGNVLTQLNFLKKSKDFIQSPHGKILEKYIENVRLNSNLSMANISDYHDIICRNTYSDLFYIPKQLFESFHFISNIFRHFNVFLEMAVPGILGGLAEHSEMEIIRGSYPWLESLLNETFAKYDNLTFFHKSKLIFYNASELGNTFCKKFLQDKLNHF